MNSLASIHSQVRNIKKPVAITNAVYTVAGTNTTPSTTYNASSSILRLSSTYFSSVIIIQNTSLTRITFPTTIDATVFVIAGGQGGASGSTGAGGGGAAGAAVCCQVTFSSNQIYTFQVGAGSPGVVGGGTGTGFKTSVAGSSWIAKGSVTTSSTTDANNVVFATASTGLAGEGGRSISGSGGASGASCCVHNKWCGDCLYF